MRYEATVQQFLGIAYNSIDDLDAGEQALTASLSITRRYDMTHHVADALTILGELDLAAGRRISSIARLQEAVRLWRTRGWASFLATALRSLGNAYAGTDEPAARAAWGEAQALFARSGHDPRAEELARQLNEPSGPQVDRRHCPVDPAARLVTLPTRQGATVRPRIDGH